MRNRANSVFITSNEVTTGGVQVTRDTGLTSHTTCQNGVPVAMNIASNNVRRSAAHEAGHAHGLSHSGNDDALTFSGAAGQPVMDGCAASTGIVAVDDRMQYAHERDLTTFTAWVGFENGTDGWTGNFSLATGSPNPGTTYALVQQYEEVRSRWGRITTPPNNLYVSTDYKGGGTNKVKFEYRRVNYPTTGNCNSNSQPPFNPNSFDWDHPTVGAADTLAHTLPASPNAWSFEYWSVATPPGGFDTWEAVDYRVVAFSESGGALFIDDLEVT